ncbi:MAG TPA: zinc-binding dehydrogenase [Puia sp.]|nr:zinc-binding dehydrogenase [Puia sp.]
MKAAVISGFGEIPEYLDFAEPVALPNETIVTVRASALENFDKAAVEGTHYASKSLFPTFPAIPGTDGVGITEDGRLVGFGGLRPPFGAFAERAPAAFTVSIPSDIDPVSAAAIPASALTSLLPLKYAGKLQPGETVLIHGATGVSGRIAVEVARLIGARRIIGTGRNKKSLEKIRLLGADVTVNLDLPDEEVASNFRDLGDVDVVLDFIWGRPAELLINSFIPGVVGFATRRIRYIHAGEKAGSRASIPGAALRTSGLELMGGGRIDHASLQHELERVYGWIREGQVHMDIEMVPLHEISKAWQRIDLAGRRLVIVS